MFSDRTIRSLVVVMVLATVMRQVLLSLICALLLLAIGIAYLWNRWSLVRVFYERELSQVRAFPGDEIELEIRIENRKPLSLIALEVRDSIPANIELIDHELQFEPDGRQVLRRTTSVRWYERVVCHYRVRCRARGSYRFGPVQLEASDPFGFYRSHREIGHVTHLLVYPTPLPLDQLGLPSRRPLGELRKQHLIRDPLRTIGVRDYNHSDPLKDVHWTATARVGTMQTRVYEPTNALELAVYLDLSSFDEPWQGIDEQQVERLISATTTIIQAAVKDGYAVGLYSNGAQAQFAPLVRLPPSRSPAQYERMMQTLARMTPYAITPVARLLHTTTNDLAWGATTLLISATAPKSAQAMLLRLHDHGRSVIWLYLGEKTPPRLAGVPIHHAPPAQDWRGNGRNRWAGTAS